MEGLDSFNQTSIFLCNKQTTVSSEDLALSICQPLTT